MERDKTAERTGFFTPLSATEKAILLSAAIAALIAMYMLVSMFCTYRGLLTSAHPNEVARVSAVGAIMQGFSGTIMAFASSLLFFVALVMQLREHRQAVEEMRKTTKNHADALKISREEKEFNVCHTAVMALVTEVERFKGIGPHAGLENIHETTRQWAAYVAWDHVVNQRPPQLRRGLTDIQDVFPSYEALLALNIRLQWLVREVKQKPLAEADREYLYTYLRPLVESVQSKQMVNLTMTVASIDRLMDSSNTIVQQLRLDEGALERLRRALGRILATMAEQTVTG